MPTFSNDRLLFKAVYHWGGPWWNFLTFDPDAVHLSGR